jgi:urease accessory protein
MHRETPKSEQAEPKPWHGCLRLRYARCREQTQVAHAYATAPLKLQRSFYPEGPQICHSVILHTAGGIVGGDRLAFEIELEPQTHALITTPTASKLYRSNGLEAQQSLQIRIGAGARLEWLPQETIVFAGAIYRQQAQIELTPTATWLGWEIVRFGRTARGEHFVQGHWRSQTEVWQSGRLLWTERAYLPGHPELLQSSCGLAGCSVVASLVFVGQEIPIDLITAIRQDWSSLPIGTELGITRLLSGVLCRYRGHSTIEARNYLLKVWHHLRAYTIDTPISIPRVWQV